MKTAAISGALVAALAAGAIAIPTASAAQPYGYDSRGYSDCRNNGAAGTIIGGIAGALLGSSVAPHHGNRAGGAAIGGVAGALIGNSVARSSSSCGTYNQAYGYGDRSYGYAQTYPSYGYASSYPTYGYGQSYGYATYGRSYSSGYDHDRYRDNDRRDHDRRDWDRDDYRR